MTYDPLTTAYAVLVPSGDETATVHATLAPQDGEVVIKTCDSEYAESALRWMERWVGHHFPPSVTTNPNTEHARAGEACRPADSSPVAAGDHLLDSDGPSQETSPASIASSNRTGPRGLGSAGAKPR
jgi:hypothetical protein